MYMVLPYYTHFAHVRVIYTYAVYYYDICRIHIHRYAAASLFSTDPDRTATSVRILKGAGLVPQEFEI